MSVLNKKTVDDINVKGKRVLVRCDFNVPLKNGVQANKTYSLELEIVNLGANLPPDGDLQKGEIRAVINMVDWESGENYTVEF